MRNLSRFQGRTPPAFECSSDRDTSFKVLTFVVATQESDDPERAEMERRLKQLSGLLKAAATDSEISVEESERLYGEEYDRLKKQLDQ
ncbi:MAG: hypothetical protein WD972_00830 [Candidatus Andersenbacteria bacterium]